MDINRKIFSLSDLGKSLRSVIEKAYNSSYWIKAEIAKLNHYPRSGHCYPELVDKSGNQVKAQMRSTIWAADYVRINKAFLDITGEPLKEGMLILFRASVAFHSVHGLALHIHDVEPAFTLGEMAMEKNKTIELLKKENIFHQNKQQSLALLPGRVAVISVETSKGYKDFLNILSAKCGKYKIWHYLFPSVLQGDKAVEGMISQLRIIRKAAQRFDMIAIIRGGGGDIGLNCYDDYKLAREIALAPLPVVTGIGHATNETVSEMVAYRNKITPTDVAYFIIERFTDFEKRIDVAARSLIATGNAFMAAEKHKLSKLESNLVLSTTHYITEGKARQDSLTGSFANGVRELYGQEQEKLNGIGYKLSVLPGRKLFEEKCTLDNYHLRLQSAVSMASGRQNAALDQLTERIRLLDPANVLKRGYSISSLNGKSITEGEQLKEGDVMETRFYQGSVRSVIKKH